MTNGPENFRGGESQDSIWTVQSSEILLDNYIAPVAEQELDESTDYVEYSVERRQKDGSLERFLGRIAIYEDNQLSADIVIVEERALSDVELISRWPEIEAEALKAELPIQTEIDKDILLAGDVAEYDEETSFTEEIFGEQLKEYTCHNVRLERGQQPEFEFDTGYMFYDTAFGGYETSSYEDEASYFDDELDSAEALLSPETTNQTASTAEEPEFWKVKRALEILLNQKSK